MKTQRRGFLKSLAVLPFVGLLLRKEKLPDKPKQAFIGGFGLADASGSHVALTKWSMTAQDGKPIAYFSEWVIVPGSIECP